MRRLQLLHSTSGMCTAGIVPGTPFASARTSTQIALVVVPILVLVSLLFSQQMNLVFNTFELVAVVLSVVIVNFIVADGESNWLEGVQLLVAYAIIGVAFFFHP